MQDPLYNSYLQNHLKNTLINQIPVLKMIVRYLNDEDFDLQPEDLEEVTLN
jgi:hypothetical protein